MVPCACWTNLGTDHSHQMWRSVVVHIMTLNFFIMGWTWSYFNSPLAWDDLAFTDFTFFLHEWDGNFKVFLSFGKLTFSGCNTCQSCNNQPFGLEEEHAFIAIIDWIARPKSNFFSEFRGIWTGWSGFWTLRCVIVWNINLKGDTSGPKAFCGKALTKGEDVSGSQLYI